MRKEDSVEVNYSGVQEVMSKYKEILKKVQVFFLTTTHLDSQSKEFGQRTN